MKAGRFSVSTRSFRIEDVPIPNPGEGQVRIKVMAAGVCLSDVHLLSGILTPAYLLGDEVTMGHEVAGVIDVLGADVSDWQKGESVIVCAGVRDSKNRVTTLGFDYDGGFAEYVITDVETLIRIPDGIPFEQACIIPDAVSTPWAAITQTAKVQRGESAAVFGVGGLGVHAVQLLKIIGASPVIGVDPLAQARERALAVGADVALDPQSDDFSQKVKELSNGKGLDVCFDFAGTTQVRTQSLKLLAEGGRLAIVGLANEPIVIPNDIAFAYKRCQVLGHYGSETHHSQELVNLLAQRKLDLSASVSAVLTLDELESAFHQLENKINNPIRIVIRPNLD
jgi:D-arabinose 1-dehydrogenase-like Zn-dependent alcohol dehydrogenase